MTNISLWDGLSQQTQEVFIAKADYLLERGYIRDEEPEDLARRIYLSGVVRDESKDDDES